MAKLYMGTRTAQMARARAKAQAVTDRAVAKVTEHANERWLRAATEAVRLVARAMPTFTTDDVWPVVNRMGVSTHEPRAMGAVMRRAMASGDCTPTDEFRASVRPECHKNPKRVYESNLYSQRN